MNGLTIKGIETTLGVLVAAEPALARLAAEKLPIKVAYHIAKLAKLVIAETELFKQQRDALVKRLGTVRAATEAERAVHGSEVWEVQPPHQREFVDQLTELLKSPSMVAWVPLEFEELKDVVLPAADLLALGPLVVEDMERVTGQE